MSTDFDICLITFNSLENDARALNMARAIHYLGYRILVVSLESTGDCIYPFITHQIKLANHKSLFRKILDFNLQAINYLKKISFKSIISSDLYSLGIAYQLKHSKSIQVIYDSREIYSALGPLYKKPIKQMFWTHLENFLIEKVDDIIVSGKLDAIYLKNYFRKRINYHLIMNLPPYKDIIKSNKIRDFYKIDKLLKIVLYQGMLLEGRGIEEAIEAFKEINGILVIFGDGPNEQSLKHLVKSLNLNEKVKFLGKVPYDELHEWTCSADLGLVLFRPISFSYELALPNKLFEYAMAGIPSISTNLPAINDLCDEYKITHLIDEISPQSIIDAFNYMSIDKNCQLISENCLKHKKTLSYESQYDIIKGILLI